MKPHEYMEHNLALLGEMKALAEGQIALIREERLDEAFALGARSRKLEQQVGESTRRCRLLLRERPGRRAEDPSNPLLVKTEKAMGELRRLNGEIEALLLHRRKALLDGMLNLRKGQKAVQRYGVGTPGRSRFIETLG